jgi:hypothetical protein
MTGSMCSDRSALLVMDLQQGIVERYGSAAPLRWRRRGAPRPADQSLPTPGGGAHRCRVGGRAQATLSTACPCTAGTSAGAT